MERVKNSLFSSVEKEICQELELNSAVVTHMHYTTYYNAATNDYTCIPNIYMCVCREKTGI